MFQYRKSVTGFSEPYIHLSIHHARAVYRAEPRGHRTIVRAEGRLYATACVLLGSVEEEEQHVRVLHLVLLALGAHGAAVLRLLHRARGDEVVVGHGLRTWSG